MLTLHRESRTIVTDENFSVKLKWVNPCCYMDAVPGDVGMGLQIAVNEYTRTEFGNPGRFEKYVTGQDRKFSDVSIRFSGALLMSGTLVITDANSETYSGWLQSDLGVLGTAQRDKFINEMAWPADVEFENKAAYVPGTDDYACIMVQNPAFWNGIGRELPEGTNYLDRFGNTKQTTEVINALTLQFREFKSYAVNNILSPSMLVDTSGPGCVVSPFLFLNYAIKEMFRINGFFVDPENNALDDPFFNPLIYNNYNIFKQGFTIEVRTESTWNPETDEDENVQIYKIMSIAWSLGLFTYADLVPRIALKDFILWIQNFLNVVFVFRPLQQVSIVNRNLVPTLEPYSLDDYFLGFWQIGERKNVSLKFIQENEKLDALFADWHDLSDRRTDFKEAVATIEDLYAIVSPSLGELRMVTDENKIYEYKWTVFTSQDQQLLELQTDVCQWAFASYGPQPFLYGDSDEIEEIKSGCSTLQGVIIPQTHQQGNISSARRLWSDFSLRLMSHGLTGPLVFEGTGGLFESRWKNWATFWKNRLPVEGEFDLPMGELYRVINNITQPYSTRHGKFIIEELECDFQGSRMGTVKMKGYKL